MNGAIIPAEISDSGTTNKSAITWKRKGNVVTVSIYNYSDTANTNITITGLPTPKGGQYINCQMFASGNNVGVIEYTSNSWVAWMRGSTAGFASFTYICE